MRLDPRPALLAALASLAGLVATGLVAFLVPVARHGDNVALQHLERLGRGRAADVADAVAHVCDPLGCALAGAILAAVGFARRGPGVALAVPVVMVGSVLTSEALKPLLGTPRSADWVDQRIAPASWPSGHATAAAAIVLCALLVLPRTWRRPVAALGIAFMLAVAYSLVSLAWHFPSDVLGGWLVAALWTSLAVAALALAERRAQRSPPGFQSGSSPALAARLRMNSRSERRLR